MSMVADLRAFGASVRKEWRIARRYPTSYVGLVFWPVLLPAVWVVAAQAYSGGDARALAAFASRAGTTEVAGFVFVGYVMFMWLSIILWGPGTAIRQEQVRGTLEAVFLTPATRLVTLFAPPVAVLPSLAMTLAVMSAAMGLLFGVALPLDGLLRTLALTLVALPALYSIATLFAAGVLRFGEISGVVQLVRGTLVLASGVTFPVLMLPDWGRAAAATLPTTYVVADIRAVLLGGLGLGDVAADIVTTLGLSLLFAALAVVVFAALERGARRTGMLGRY